jgi:hypothetical protein
MSDNFLRRFNAAHWKRVLIFWGVVVVAILVFLLITWNTFFTYVKPGQHLVVIAKDGKPLPPDHVLAEPGEKGPLAQVLGEGWHFVMPVVYETRLEDNTTIPPGKVGVVTALGGEPLRPDQYLADEGQRGIQRRVLPPGMYRLNLHGYKVDVIEATEIPPGYVGVQQRKLGTPAKGQFAEKEGERGYLKEVLQPGIYYVNTQEFQVDRAEVGIFQTTFAAHGGPGVRPGITFVSGGFPISVDCTVEWETLPEDMPRLLAEYGSRKRIEENVIDLQAHAIGRDKGSDYSVQDLLEGSKRQKYQEDFTKELIAVCKDKHVTVHSAFIRNIEIPPTYLKQVQETQLNTQKALTAKVKKDTAESSREVEKAKKMVDQEVEGVNAKTKSLVALIDNDVQNLKDRTQAELKRMRDANEAEIAKLNAERDRVLGKAKAEAKELEETAKSTLSQMQMEAFRNDPVAFQRYSMAKQLNPALRLRLFHSGPGTFWTNMEGSKGMSLMLSPGGAAPAAESLPPPREE